VKELYRADEIKQKQGKWRQRIKGEEAVLDKKDKHEPYTIMLAATLLIQGIQINLVRKYQQSFQENCNHEG
jgi:hypothetical protein